jgi:transcriptional regulator with XRE-family HTH domain
LTQVQAARQLGISVTAYNFWESGRIAPGITKWPKIIQFIGFDPTPEPTTFSDALRALRRARGFEQRTLAARLGVDTKSVVNWELGRTRPFRATRKKLADIAPGEPLLA